MLDDLRKHADSSEFEEETPVFEEAPPVQKPFLGMKPWQRFVIALMLLFMVIVLGAFCLLVTEKVVLPFY
jgi:hypothetical protein